MPIYNITIDIDKIKSSGKPDEEVSCKDEILLMLRQEIRSLIDAGIPNSGVREPLKNSNRIICGQVEVIGF